MFRKSALPELLSPAGSYEALVAAVNAGADAVYFGGKKLNARTFARNFEDEEIARAIVYCHLHGAKAYVTLNTLLSERELQDAVRRAGELRELGADALIVADLGLIARISEVFPPYHEAASKPQPYSSPSHQCKSFSNGTSRSYSPWYCRTRIRNLRYHLLSLLTYCFPPLQR